MYRPIHIALLVLGCYHKATDVLDLAVSELHVCFFMRVYVHDDNDKKAS